MLPGRCYNCGEFANHVAAKCVTGPLPKRCHQCKSHDHLIADCPVKPDRRRAACREQEKTDQDPSKDVSVGGGGDNLGESSTFQ